MPSSDVAFAVVIPAHDRRALIGATLESVLAQRHPAAEIVVVDDGSTDDTGPFVAATFPRVRVIRQQRSGVCAARNAGVAASGAPWIAFCDSDDLWDPDHLAQRAALIRAHPEIRVSFGDFRLLRDGVMAADTKFAVAPAGWFDGMRRSDRVPAWLVDFDLLPRLLRFQPIFPSTLVVARSAFDGVGGFDPALGFTVSEDLDFTLRCLPLRPLAAMWLATVTIRKHAGNMSGRGLDDLLGEIAVLRHALANYARESAHAPAVAEEIGRRLTQAFDAAFAARRFATARSVAAEADRGDWTARQWLKLAIARLPRPLAQIVADVVESAGGVTRRPGTALRSGRA